MVKIAVALAGSMADELTTAFDGGAGPAVCVIYDENGAGIPADLSVAITTQVVLVSIPLNDPSFAGFIDATPGAQIVLDVTPEPEANAVATAGGSPTLFARIEDSNGLEHQQFDTVGVGSGELQINSLAIQNLAAVVITAGSFTMGEG